MIQDSTAIRVALGHIEAWSSHDWAKTRELLSQDIHAVVTTLDPARSTSEFTGVDRYMERKLKGAQLVEPGSVNVISAIGDERSALILAKMRIALGPKKAIVTLVRACLYLLDEDKRIKEERDQWFVPTE